LRLQNAQGARAAPATECWVVHAEPVNGPPFVEAFVVEAVPVGTPMATGTVVASAAVPLAQVTPVVPVAQSKVVTPQGP